MPGHFSTLCMQGLILFKNVLKVSKSPLEHFNEEKIQSRLRRFRVFFHYIRLYSLFAISVVLVMVLFIVGKSYDSMMMRALITNVCIIFGNFTEF